MKFSLKKLLLCLLCSVIITTSIGSTIIFIFAIPKWNLSEYIITLGHDPSTAKKLTGGFLERYQETIVEECNRQRELYGDDFPAEAFFTFDLMNFATSDLSIHTYILTFILGIIIGTIVYIVFVQKSKGINLLFSLIFALAIIVALILLVNFSYNTVMTHRLNELSNELNLIYDSPIFNIKIILLAFLIIFVTIYIINMVHQKIITNKLNKELEKIGETKK